MFSTPITASRPALAARPTRSCTLTTRAVLARPMAVKVRGLDGLQHARRALIAC